MKKIFKGLVAISDVLDDRYQKLSDNYHDLELSHNRKKKALDKLLIMFLKIHQLIEDTGEPWKWEAPALDYCVKICSDALFSDGRANGRPIVQRKKKGGIE